MGVEKKVYSFRLDPALVEQLQNYAEQENRSLSNLVETILKQHILSRDPESKTLVGI